MTVVVNSLTCGSGMGIFWSVRRVIRDLACGIGVVVTLLYLAGCATKAETEIRYVRVEVPVPVPCRAPHVATPPWASAGLRKTDSLDLKVRALLAERRQRIGYEKLLSAALISCQ
ncbi:hypothetical protein QN085_09905 [Pseudomonas sp. M2(2023)]|uniref:hypothetical protein n=1 Tax=Pseudomonas sp. M2(2023) TaxID=3049084 RepID=UPI002554B75D|nr:hypothetical protein [Pseudomonas sp. M2(2023)]WIV25879.1 hypothetical protein QN085_09905 [Pseudomonas sp. M2(2023)]